MVKRTTSVTLDDELYFQAKEQGLNISGFIEEQLRAFLFDLNHEGFRQSRAHELDLFFKRYPDMAISYHKLIGTKKNLVKRSIRVECGFTPQESEILTAVEKALSQGIKPTVCSR